MKILCVIDSLGSGGAQRQLVNLAIGFKEKGHDVSFLVYHRDDFYEQILRENDIFIHEIIEPNYFKRLMKMRRFIRKGNFDAVLSFLEAANFICEIAGLPKRKWKLVVGERSANPKILKSVKLRTYRWLHLLADHVVANSHENIKIVRKINPFLSKKKCHVIYNMIDFVKWRPNINFQPKKDGKLHILVSARHQYLKNLNGLVEAVKLLNDEEKNKLIIEWYGDENDNSKDEAINKIKKYGLENCFYFHDASHNILKITQQTDVVGIFSFYEGLPNAICEGMACAKPVIGPKISDIPNFIDNNYLFDPQNPASIKRTLQFILSMNIDNLIKIGKRNYNIAQQFFNKDFIINTYLNLIKSL